MRSIQLVDQRRLEPRDMPEPGEPAPGEVLVRIRAVGICGSDLHWYREGGICGAAARYPQVLGHEPAGEVVAAGAGVSGLRPGQRVAVEPAITCGHCELCLAGRRNNCLHSQFMGSPQLPGLFREYAVVPVHNVVPVPDSMGFAAITLIEPVAVIVHVFELSPVRVGDTVAVLGAGPMGLLTAMLARHAGAARVFIGDRVPERVALASRLRFDAVEMPRSRFAESVLDRTNGRGVDLAFDCAGASETLNAAIRVTRPGGRLTCIGIPSENSPQVDWFPAFNKELSIQTIRRSNETAHAALTLMEAGAVDPAVVTHRFELAQTPEAFVMLDEYQDGVGKAVIEAK